jgi:hypothetical protein
MFRRTRKKTYFDLCMRDFLANLFETATLGGAVNQLPSAASLPPLATKKPKLKLSLASSLTEQNSHPVTACRTASLAELVLTRTRVETHRPMHTRATARALDAKKGDELDGSRIEL